MANKALFNGKLGWLPKPDARNAHGAPAYGFAPKHALAQYAATGCLNATFYANADEQLEVVLDLVRAVDDTFVAKTASKLSRSMSTRLLKTPVPALFTKISRCPSDRMASFMVR